VYARFASAAVEHVHGMRTVVQQVYGLD